jgi:signal transduction histidine kinase
MEEFEQLSKDINIINLLGLPLDRVRLRVASLPSNAAIAYIPIYTDKTGKIHDPLEGLKAIIDSANRPIVVDAEPLVGTGATGGYVMSADRIGRELGKRVAQILAGQSASNMPVTDNDFNEPVFDYRQLKRWGVNADSLPAESKVLFREASIWEKYRPQMSAVAMLVVVQCIIIVWLFVERQRRRVAEREAHQHLLEVAQLDRATTASAISSSIAHELKQPLGAILSNAEAAEMLLDATTPDRDQLKEILLDIQRDDHRAVEIIEHLRKLLHQSELSASLVDLAEVVNDVLQIIKPQAAENGVTVKFASVPSNLWVKADPIHLQQVMLNLAMNAIDAMSNTDKSNRQLTLRLEVESREAVISIEDTGAGIPNDKLKNIFKPFVTTKAQGTGLGLSIAQTIIGTYGGVIWAENRPEGGAAFRFKLNLAQMQAA